MFEKRELKNRKRKMKSYYEGFEEMENLKEILIELKRCQF
ncbi:hypothetical protein SAMN02745164_00913 [Marinitoga hydrogenitolerans DSM 16785]|uniref:Uncharacterized protein n=1 Tax=Marinitoga hydrogenitolerans (strain DSM 16785 / JCM 12826 / AT1271) TaxID=1122195 RepID=A0A1M4VFR1_MARH1|nr:hypothetical protein SAMN02745164_00913 [Marinitoga hydrogenitolerans DSM 16785]